MRVDVSYYFKPNPEAHVQIANSDGVQQFTAMKAKVLIFHARRIFASRVKHTHPVTPPPYFDSFFMRKASALRGKKAGYIVGNSDPAAILVEFGAHPAGGTTFVLGYRPLGAALDAMEG
jgi:hypothetical protein